MIVVVLAGIPSIDLFIEKWYKGRVSKNESLNKWQKRWVVSMVDSN